MARPILILLRIPARLFFLYARHLGRRGKAPSSTVAILHVALMQA